MNTTRLRQTVVLAVVLLLAVGAFFFVRGRPANDGEGARGGEPTVVVVHEDGRRDEMPMEQYVKGVVAGEMGRLPPKGEEDEADWPTEAYAAQAILARSFAMDYLEEAGGNEIAAEHEAAQAYNPDNIIPAIEEGVEMTRGRVMMYGDEYVRAWFHSYSGGKTATAKEGLDHEDVPYVNSVDTGKNEYAPDDVTDWRFRQNLSDVETALAAADVDVGNVRDVRIKERGPSNRVTAFEIVGGDGTQTVSGNEFRLAVGAEKLKSTRIDEWEVKDDVLTATGTGFGHGVGLSQWDTYKMAKDGRAPEDIVTFFFDGVDIRKMWD